MQRDGPTGHVDDEIRARLGISRIGSRREIHAMAALVEGERLDAVGVAIWERRAWGMVASESGFRLVRRPHWFGRPRDEHFDWADLTAVQSVAQRVELTFGNRTLRFAVTPHDELVRLLDAARRHLAGDNTSVAVEEIRALARRDLGRWLTVGFEAVIDALPDRLEPDECVERVAGATLESSGLLVITDRRVMLFSVGVRFERERVWSVARREIRSAAPLENGLWLDLGDRAVILTDIVPAKRLPDLLADLLPRPADQT